MSEAAGRASSREEFEHLLSEALDADRSYSMQNSVRRRLVAQEVARPAFHQAELMVDGLIQPLEHGVNFLLGHTKMLADLKYVGRRHKAAGDLQRKCCASFLHLVTGGLADKLLKSYMLLLENGLHELCSMGFCPSAEHLNLMFSSVAVLCTDLYRRLKMDFAAAPFRLFRLINMTDEEFLQAWNDLEAQCEACAACLDGEFTRPLLRQFPALLSQPPGKQRAAVAELRALLTDCATWAAVTSDMVELKNGQVQFAVSKRGSQNVKGPVAATEVSLVQAAVLQHEWIKDTVAAETLPTRSQSSGILGMSGVKTTRAEDRLLVDCGSSHSSVGLGLWAFCVFFQCCSLMHVQLRNMTMVLTTPMLCLCL